MHFFFVRWIIPGQKPQGSRTFRTFEACQRYAKHALKSHPSWTAEIVRHDSGEQQEQQLISKLARA